MPKDLQSRITDNATIHAHALQLANPLLLARPMLPILVGMLDREGIVSDVIPSPGGFGIALRIFFLSAARSPEPRGRRRGSGCCASGLPRTVASSSSGSISALLDSLSCCSSASDGEPNELRSDAGVAELRRDRRRTETCASIFSTGRGDGRMVRPRRTRGRGLGLRGLILRGLGLRSVCC